MKKFAVLINKSDLTCSSSEEGTIRVYANNEEINCWDVINDIGFSLINSSSLSEIRRKIEDMISKLGECKVFIAREVTGQLYSVLEAHRFSIYEVDGEPEQFLSSILELENDNQMVHSNENAICSPQKTNIEGCYTLNLKEVLNSNPDMSSKKILIPFLIERNFKELEIVCDHVPKWLNAELEKFKMRCTISKTENGDSKLVIFS